MLDHPAPQPDPNQVPHPAEALPNGAEKVGTMQNDAAPFRTVPHVAESFGTVPNPAEEFHTPPVRRDNCTLTVREVARLFENAGVARSERSITNWCQPNRQGIARLEAYFDPNERRYFITPQSVEAAVSEERQKLAKLNHTAEAFGKEDDPEFLVPQGSEDSRWPSARTSEPFRSEPVADHRSFGKDPNDSESNDHEQIRDLEREVMDLKITNRAKDMFIEQLKNERKSDVGKLVLFSRKIGELSNRLLQLGAPKDEVEATASLEEDPEQSPTE